MKKASGIFKYYVEGDDEKRLIEVLKTDMRLIIPEFRPSSTLSQRFFWLKVRLIGIPDTCDRLTV